MNQSRSLSDALKYLARLEGVSLDSVQLASAIGGLVQCGSMVDLKHVCERMDFAPPVIFQEPDPINLPMLTLHTEYGWCVVTDVDAQGAWRVRCADGVDSRVESIGECAVVKLVGKGFAQLGEQGGFSTTLRSSISQYRSVLTEAVFATLFIGALALAISLFSMQVYDRVIPTRSEATLMILGVGVVLAIVLEMVMKFARSRIMDAVVVGMDSRLSRDIFEHLLNIRIDQMPGSVGSLAAQIRGYEQVRSFYTSSTLFALVDVPMCVLFVGLIAMIGSPILAVSSLVFGVLALLAGLGLRRQINRLASEGMQAANLKTGLLVEAVEGAETIKAGAGSWKMLSRWMHVNAAGIENDLRMRRASEGLGYVGGMLQQLSYAGLVAIGAWLVMRGDMTVGALIASSILGGRVMAPMLTVPSLMVQHAHAQAATRSLEALYALKSDHHGVARPLVPGRLDGHFVLDDVKFGYPDSPLAIRVNRLVIQAGERVGILGPIGAGKSTLLRMLSGLYLSQSGRVLLDGLDISHISRHVLSQKIGYLQQDHRLFMGTLRDNLLIGLPDPGDEVLQRVIRRSGLSRLVAHHPKGLDLPIMEGGKGLSGGQRQLVAFTRLLLTNPSILLLDEPTASMDDEQERRCLGVIAEEATAGKTLVLVTHKPALLPLVDRLIVVASQTVILDGPRDAVLAQLAQRTTSSSMSSPAVVEASFGASKSSLVLKKGTI